MAALAMALTILPEPIMTDQCRCANPQTDRIRALNDAFRTSLIGGSVMVTRAVVALGTEAQREILAALRRYDEFDADNDPYGEHDFGRITVQGHEILFKIDYYDQSLTLHSPDPSDPAIMTTEIHAQELVVRSCVIAAVWRCGISDQTVSEGPIRKEIILAWRVGPSGDTVPVTLREQISSIRAILQPDGSVQDLYETYRTHPSVEEWQAATKLAREERQREERQAKRKKNTTPAKAGKINHNQMGDLHAGRYLQRASLTVVARQKLADCENQDLFGQRHYARVSGK